MQKKIITRSELAINLGDALDEALRAPIIVTKHGLLKNVLLSYEEYERLVMQKRWIGKFQGWSAIDIAALEKVEMDPAFKCFDAEVEAE